MNKIKPRSRSSRSTDRSSTQSGTYSTSRSRSASDSRLQSQYDSKVTDLEPIKSISSSLEVQTSRGTVKYNGLCNGPDYYSRILGPTVDESILVGLKMLINMGFALPNCTDFPPRHELPATLESATDVASQTESSGTESKTSQTTEIGSSVISSADVPIGVSEETYSVDYEASIFEESETPEPITETPETESESPEPKSTESLTNISPSLTSEELIEIIEPTKTSTILISEPIEEETLSKEEISEVSIHNSEKLVDEDPVEEPDDEPAVESVKDEKSEVIIREVSPIKIEEEIVEAPPVKIEEKISEEVPLEKIFEETAEELSEEFEKQISTELRSEEIKVEIPEEVASEEPEESYKSEETRKSEKEIKEQEFTEPQSTVTEEELQTEGFRIDDDILSLSEVVGNESHKSQDDSETSEILSTFVTPIKESSVSKYRNYRSNFVDEIVVATATYAQDDLPLLHSQEITRSKTSIKPSRVSIKESKPSKMSDTDSEADIKEPKHSRRASKESAQESKRSKRDSKDSRRGSDESKKRQEPERKESKKERKSSLEQSESMATKDRKSLSEKSKSKERRSTMETKKSNESRQTKASKISEKRKAKEEAIQEVTETDITEDTDQSITTRTLETTSDSSSEGSGDDSSEEKCPTKNKCSKTDKSSSTASILKSSTSSKSKESSTDTYICACHINTNGEQQHAENIRCMCPSSYCPRCETKKTPVVVTCPFITACMTSEGGGPNEIPRNGERTCTCTTAIINDIMKNQNQKNNCDRGTENRDRSTIEDQKLLCDCYTSTSSTGYTSGSDSNGNMQRGDCPAKGNVRYAITKITEYGRFTTFEVMKSTKKVPKFMPKGLEGVFVLKHKS